MNSIIIEVWERLKGLRVEWELNKNTTVLSENKITFFSVKIIILGGIKLVREYQSVARYEKS